LPFCSGIFITLYPLQVPFVILSEVVVRFGHDNAVEGPLPRLPCLRRIREFSPRLHRENGMACDLTDDTSNNW